MLRNDQLPRCLYLASEDYMFYKDVIIMLDAQTTMNGYLHDCCRTSGVGVSRNTAPAHSMKLHRRAISLPGRTLQLGRSVLLLRLHALGR